MNRLPKELQELLNEAGIPESAAYLPPETCTCGIDGCDKHETWGDRLIDAMFKDFEGTWDGPVPDLLEEIEKLKNFKFPAKN
jgi:hypothetical protein